MNLKKTIKKFLFGLSNHQEYICLEHQNFPNPLQVHLTCSNDPFSIDVTSTHLFLGYKPLIIGIPLKSNSKEASWLDSNMDCCLSFFLKDTTQYANWKGRKVVASSLARLMLRRFEKREIDGFVIYFFEGMEGDHQFINEVHQVINRLKEKFYNTKGSNNIDLNGSLYDQVRIAYAIPRTISIITVTDGTKMNMFPTDLHGGISDSIYVSSLRVGGKANQQVEQMGRLVISEVSSDWYEKAYGMGKNHVQEFKPYESFPISTIKSTLYSIPLPEGVLSYKELQQLESFDKGVHRIHLYKIHHGGHIKKGNKLTHIHQYFVQWREDHGMPIDELKFRV